MPNGALDGTAAAIRGEWSGERERDALRESGLTSKRSSDVSAPPPAHFARCGCLRVAHECAHATICSLRQKEGRSGERGRDGVGGGDGREGL